MILMIFYWSVDYLFPPLCRFCPPSLQLTQMVLMAHVQRDVPIVQYGCCDDVCPIDVFLYTSYVDCAHQALSTSNKRVTVGTVPVTTNRYVALCSSVPTVQYVQ
jgi:hypothetical protein